MSILGIRTFPDPILARKASGVGDIDREVRRLMDDMVQTMYESLGIGLAAPQVGVSSRIIVVDPSCGRDPAALLRLADPVIVSTAGDDEELEEGCLSIPDFTHRITRAGRILVQGRDPDGMLRTIEAEGMMARVLQHEIDHIEGLLFIDRLSGLKRQMVRKKLRKQAADGPLP